MSKSWIFYSTDKKQFRTRSCSSFHVFSIDMMIDWFSPPKANKLIEAFRHTSFWTSKNSNQVSKQQVTNSKCSCVPACYSARFLEKKNRWKQANVLSRYSTINSFKIRTIQRTEMWWKRKQKKEEKTWKNTELCIFYKFYHNFTFVFLRARMRRKVNESKVY